MAHILPYFPFTLCFKKTEKKNLKYALREAILAELNKQDSSGIKDLEVSQLDKEMKLNPFL